MIIVKGEAVGSGVPPEKRGIPASAERKNVTVSPAVAKSIKKARSKPEPAQPAEVKAGFSGGGSAKAEPEEFTDTEREADQQATQAEVDEPEVEGPPKDYASKTDWVDWAVSRGADRDEAETLTKNELIDLYGGD